MKRSCRDDDKDMRGIEEGRGRSERSSVISHQSSVITKSKRSYFLGRKMPLKLKASSYVERSGSTASRSFLGGDDMGDNDVSLDQLLLLLCLVRRDNK